MTFKPPKFGSKLDKKLPHIPRPNILAVDEWDSYLQKQNRARAETLLDLMDYFAISIHAQDRWQHLAYKLAERFVPAMHFQERRGQPTKWSDFKRYALHILVDELSQHHPKKVAYAQIKKAAHGTVIEKLVARRSPKSLENIHYEFLNTDGFAALNAVKKSLLADPKRYAAFRNDILYGGKTLPN